MKSPGQDLDGIRASFLAELTESLHGLHPRCARLTTALQPDDSDPRNAEENETSEWPTARGNGDNQIVIPQYDVTPTIDVDYARLRIPTAYKVVNSFAVVRDYEPLIDVEWDDARQCVEAEARWLDRAAQASTAEEFDRILASAPGEESPDDFDWLFRYLDIWA